MQYWADASAVRDFIEYGLAQDGMRLIRRVDIAEHWVSSFAPAREELALPLRDDLA